MDDMINTIQLGDCIAGLEKLGPGKVDLAFADPSHFARFFRKQTGTTPQAFRDGHG